MNNNPVRYTDPSGHDVGCAGQDASSCSRKDRKYQTANKSQVSRKTVYERSLDGDVGALTDLLLPTHVGWRVQGEITFLVGSVSCGGNLVLNRNDGNIAMSFDGAGEVGPGITIGPAGTSATSGVLIGWSSSSVDDVVKGDSAILSATAASGPAFSLGITTPLSDGSDKNTLGLHVDDKYGQVPPTLFLGAGFGAEYAGVSGGLSKSGFYAKINMKPILNSIFSFIP